MTFCTDMPSSSDVSPLSLCQSSDYKHVSALAAKMRSTNIFDVALGKFPPREIAGLEQSAYRRSENNGNKLRWAQRVVIQTIRQVIGMHLREYQRVQARENGVRQDVPCVP